MKLITDRRIYDNNGNYQTQSAVKPEFDMKEVDKALKDHVDTGGNNYYADKDIVKEFVKRKKEESEGFQPSIREIPSIGYHVTAEKNSSKIDKEGIKSPIGKRWRKGKEEDIPNEVYIWKDLKDAEKFKQLHEEDGTPMVIKSVNLSGLNLKKDPETMAEFFGDKYGAGSGYIVSGNIPSSSILDREKIVQPSIRTTEPATEKYKTKGNLNYLVEESMRVSETMAALEEQKSKREKNGQTTAEIDARLVELGRQYDVLDSFMGELLTVRTGLNGVSPLRTRCIHTRTLVQRYLFLSRLVIVGCA
jgi:hypothetical protein